MKKRILGKTGFEVSELALGGVFLSQASGNTFEESKSAVLKALELGVNYIDTAPMYGNSEEILGRALEGYDKPVVISTKLGAYPEPFLPKDRDCLMRSVEHSLQMLKIDRIDLLMIHEPDRPGQFDWWTDFENFRGPVMDLLDELKRTGVVKYIGLGGTTSHELARLIDTGRFDVVLTAFNYSALWREAEIEILPAAKRQGMGIVIGAPFQQGALAVRYDGQVRNGASWMSLARRKQFLAFYDFLDEIGMSITEICVRFVISNPDISCLLMGIKSVGEAIQNAAAIGKGPLPADILKRLDEIAAMVPFRPFEEPFQLPFTRDYKGPGKTR
jgi:aryl-alcohol dehydrogenase-like predicted oxidoreductase